jgi:hypothetical protein
MRLLAVEPHRFRIASAKGAPTLCSGRTDLKKMVTFRDKKRRAVVAALLLLSIFPDLAFDYVDDFMCRWTKNNVSPAHQNEIVTSPLRVNFNNPCRKRIIPDRTRNDGSYGDVEVNVRDFFNLLRLDGGRNLALFFGRWGRSSRIFRVGRRSSFGISRGSSSSLLVAG